MPFAYASNLGFCRYTTEDYLLLKWQQEMIEAGEFFSIFQGKKAQPVEFLQLFQQPCNLFFIAGQEKLRIRYAMWLTPNWYGADIGVWIEPSLRHEPKGSYGFNLGKAIWSMAFAMYKEIGGITSQIDFLKRHEKDGLKIVGKYPVQMNGYDKWLFFFPREEFLKGPYNINSTERSSEDGDQAEAEAESKVELNGYKERPTANDLLE